MSCTQCLAEIATVGLGTTYLVLWGCGIAWAGIWLKEVVFPFYNKPAGLRDIYKTNGRISSAKSAIESNRLIPILAGMFQRILDERPAGKAKFDVAAVLESIDYVDDLANAQKAIADIEAMTSTYDLLKTKARRIWQWGLAHALLTPLTIGVCLHLYMDDSRMKWVISVLVIGWVMTLLMMILGLCRFHSLGEAFENSLDSHGGDGQ